MTTTAFSTKWDRRFPSNDTFEITAADLREFKDDILSVFGLTPALVPAYRAGTVYAPDYLVRYVIAGQPESFFYSLQAGVLPAPTGASDAYWKVVPGPVVAAALSQQLTLLQAQGIEGSQVVAGRTYIIDFGPDANSNAQLVTLLGTAANLFAIRGQLTVNGVRSNVRVNVASGVFGEEASNLLTSDNYWSGHNEFEQVVTLPDIYALNAPAGRHTIALLATAIEHLEYAFGANCLLLENGQKVRGFVSAQAALDAAGYGGVVLLLLRPAGVLTVAKSCEIHCGPHSVGGLTVQNGANCLVRGNLVSNQTVAININTGSVELLGDTEHTSDAAGTATVSIYPSGSFKQRGRLTLTSASPTAIGLIAAGDTRIDFEGKLTIANKGRVARGSNKFRLAGHAVSADGGVELFRGACDVSAIIDTRLGAGPALTIIQYTEYHRLHAGTSLLSPAGMPSIANGNPAAGIPTIEAAPAVAYSQLPDPTLVTVLPLGRQLLVAAASGTVLVFTRDAEYATIYSGTFTVDVTGAEVGAVVTVRLGASASAPSLPSGFVQLGDNTKSGDKKRYSFCVAPDNVIEYYVTKLT